jgi:hypothetical protein
MAWAKLMRPYLTNKIIKQKQKGWDVAQVVEQLTSEQRTHIRPWVQSPIQKGKTLYLAEFNRNK